MEHIVNAMNSYDIKVQIGATRCLHSLSRSVQQLRTTFQDHAVWKPLMNVSMTSQSHFMNYVCFVLEMFVSWSVFKHFGLQFEFEYFFYYYYFLCLQIKLLGHIVFVLSVCLLSTLTFTIIFELQEIEASYLTCILN